MKKEDKTLDPNNVKFRGELRRIEYLIKKYPSRESYWSGYAAGLKKVFLGQEKKIPATCINTSLFDTGFQDGIVYPEIVKKGKPKPVQPIVPIFFLSDNEIGFKPLNRQAFDNEMNRANRMGTMFPANKSYWMGYIIGLYYSFYSEHYNIKSASSKVKKEIDNNDSFLIGINEGSSYFESRKTGRPKESDEELVILGSVRIPKSLHDLLQQYAKNNKYTTTDVVIKALKGLLISKRSLNQLLL